MPQTKSSTVRRFSSLMIIQMFLVFCVRFLFSVILYQAFFQAVFSTSFTDAKPTYEFSLKTAVLCHRKKTSNSFYAQPFLPLFAQHFLCKMTLNKRFNLYFSFYLYRMNMVPCPNTQTQLVRTENNNEFRTFSPISEKT